MGKFVVRAQRFGVVAAATIALVFTGGAASAAPSSSIELTTLATASAPAGPLATAVSATCPKLGTYSAGTAPSKKSPKGVTGTTTADIAAFAKQYNAQRIANCLPPVTKFIYDSCMEQRLFWMAESPAKDPLDAWGHIGSKRIDGVPSVGCDGNLAGGANNTGATVATKWWTSTSHRASLYRPGTSVTGVCIAFAMTHGGDGDPYSFTRAAARWVKC